VQPGLQLRAGRAGAVLSTAAVGWEAEDVSKFIPDIGTLFYAVSRRSLYRESGFGLTATLVKVPDRSWEDAIFRAVAADDRVLIGDIAHGCGYISNKRITLVRADYDFMPVGPDVVAALGLAGEGAAA
jgi:hypothetical protein